MKRIAIFIICLIALTALAITYPSSTFFGGSVQNQTTAGGVCTAIGAVQTVNNGSEFAANGFPAGISVFGSQNGMAAATDGSVLWNFNGSTTGHARAGDGGLYIENWSTNRNNSGSQVGVVVMGLDVSGNATALDLVGSAIAHVPFNRYAGIIPGWTEYVQNPTTNNQGFAFCATGWGPDSQNYSLLQMDYMHKALRVPLTQQGIYQPNDKVYLFTVSGISVAPSLGDMYSNSTSIFTVCNGNGSDGTHLAMTGQTAPAGSGNLTRVNIATGHATPDATIAFSTASVVATAKDVLFIDPVLGRVSLTNGYLAPAVLYSNNAVNISFSGEYANYGTIVVTNHSGTVQLPDPTAYKGMSKTVKALGNTTINLAAGTFGDVGVTGFTTSTTTFQAFTSRSVTWTAVNGQWWVTSNSAN